MFKKIILILFIFSLTACQSTGDFVTINDNKIYIEIADTPTERSQGLSNRQSLADDHGMLFVFDNYTLTSFWMKDMQFPIDIIWIKDDTIIDIDKNVPIPNNEALKHYTPSQPINYVLEVNAGYSEQLNIKIGDKININN